MESPAIDFELYGDTPEITVPVKIELIDQHRPVNFKIAWKRHETETARELLQKLTEQEQYLEGTEFMDWQQTQIYENARRIIDLPVKGGRKISAGAADDPYDLDDVLEKLLRKTSYHNAIYQSYVGSLAEKNLHKARRGN